MSLPSNFSIHDVFLLAKSASTIAKAFTAANSAPAEFAEIRSLLHSVSESLKLLARIISGHPGGGDDELSDVQPVGPAHDETLLLVTGIIANCQSVVNDSQDFISKYSILETDPRQNGGYSWRDQFKKNWKRATWTKQEGDVTKLKQTLTAHTNTLNLAIAIINRGQQTLMQGKLEDAKDKLDDIHQWFANSLNEQGASAQAEKSKGLSSMASDSQETAFWLYEETVVGIDMEKVVQCPRATLKDNALSPQSLERNSPSIFRCCCQEYDLTIKSATINHHSSKLEYTLLPISMLVRLAGSPERGNWQIYAASPRTNSPVSLIITESSPIHQVALESWANRLAMIQAASHMANNVYNAFVLRNRNEISILSTKGSIGSLGARLLSIRFSANGSQFSVHGFESMQLLHYATMPKDSLDPDLAYETGPGLFSYTQHANIIVTRRTIVTNPYTDMEGGERYYIQLTHETTFSNTQRIRYVAIQNPLCVMEGGGEHLQSNSIRCQEAEFEFADAAVAEEFLNTLKDMKQRLLVQYLQHARWGDRVIYERHVGDIMIRNLFLRDARLKVVLDPDLGKSRMIVLRGDHSASVTFELPAHFLEELSGGTVAVQPNYPAWFVEARSDGISVTKGGSGINPLSPLGNQLHLALRLK